MHENDYQNNSNQERSAIEARIKNIDEQIVLLNNLKVQNLVKLQSFPLSTTLQTNSLSNGHISDEKIALFKSYFRGREDVYSKLWINNKTGKRGYSPVCKHEWNRALCRKPAIKCSECPNQGFLPLDETAIKQHLNGIQVMGVYPMLKNESCYFLAIDFDKEHWMDDVQAIMQTCHEEGVPAAVERSRSGNGGHVWIFFSEEVPAVLARRLGSFLITQSMSKRYQMDMKSYDRLFPSQDTLPKGGFGNLIALPFQKEAGANGNSLFIDKNGKPYTDQWHFLASVKKMSYKEVEEKAEQAIKTGQVIAARPSPVQEDDEPWMRLPSGKKRFKVDVKDLPQSIDAVLANRIYIKTGQGPSVLYNQLKHLAAFQNPEFYKKQRMRFSTHATPRVICCAEIIDGYLALPRGCLEDAQALLKGYDVKLNIEDKRVAGLETNFDFDGTLNEEQEEALEGVLEVDFGVFVAPPGTGKTVLAIAAIAKRKTNVLVLVHRKPIMDQWRLQLASFLGINKKEIGQIGGGKNKATGVIDVGMVQSLDMAEGVYDGIANYGFVIVDECHHVGAVSFEKVLTQAKAKYVLGLTATPYRGDGHQPIIHMQCGPICHRIKQKDMTAHISSSIVIPRATTFSYPWIEGSKIVDLSSRMVESHERNQLIIDDIINVLDAGRFPLILTERREHLEMLAKLLQGRVEFLAVLHGGIKQKQRRETFQQIKDCPDHCRKAILATGSYIGEGFDEPRLNTLFLTMPSSFKGKIVQYAGRLHRYHKDKQDVQIYDYVDHEVSVLGRMFQRRLKTYKLLGYEIDANKSLSRN
ncbi:MAG: DEAD/DEAH box helicase family protein [Candidatus Omnitrophica bacterium]|nr:DEAD/DEAH box helicase family protein [Candidatus Omnitrophota bacterium]